MKTLPKARNWIRNLRDRGRDPFNQNSNREKRTTSKGGPIFSKLFRLDRTDPLTFGPKFPEILVEWIAPRNGNLSGPVFFFFWRPYRGHITSNRTLNCRRKVTDVLLIFWYSVRKLSSVRQCLFLADSCTHIKSIGKPVTHNNRLHHYGAWMKDPLGIMGAETIFVMENYYDNNVLEEFENMDMFKAGITRKKYILPYNWDGTGGVVYGPYLYYNRY